MEKASFSIVKYIFNKVNIDLDKRTDNELNVKFDVSGVFVKEDSTFDLTFDFQAFSEPEGELNPFVNIRCVGTFEFNNVNKLEEIPTFFYRNSIAILFPYVRSYVSMVTNQANVRQVSLPVMNLSSLEKPLRENTKEK